MKKESIIGLGIILLIWYLLSLFKIINPIFFPNPQVVLVKMGSLLITGDFIWDLSITLFRMAVGFILSSVIGISLGLVIGYFKKLYDYLDFVIDFFRSIPVTALIPLFICLFGINSLSKIIIIATAGMLIMFVNTIYGVKNVDPIKLLVARSFNLGSWELFTQVIFPQSIPHIIAGTRVCISLCLILAVVSEILMGGDGLGARIYNAHLMYRIDEMYASIIVTGISGYIINKLFCLLEEKLVHWEGK